MNEESIREKVLEGMCPFCPAGPFKLLARHTNVAHGVDRRELRLLAGLPFTRSILDQEFRTRISEERRARSGGKCPFTPEQVAKGRQVEHDISPAARRSWKEQADRVRPSPERQSERMKALPDERREYIKARQAEGLEKRRRPVWDRAVDLWRLGVPLQQIADEIGTTRVNTVREILRREGIWV